MLNASTINTRSKTDLRNIDIHDLLLRSPSRIRNPLLTTVIKDQRRQSRLHSPIPPHFRLHLSSATTIPFPLDEEDEVNDTTRMDQQQFKDAHKQELTDLNTAVAAGQQIHKKLRDEIPTLTYPDLSETDILHWFNIVENVFSTLNYHRLLWVEEAITHFQDESLKQWFGKMSEPINNNWEKFKLCLLQFYKGEEPQTTAPISSDKEQHALTTENKIFDDFIRKNFTKFSGAEVGEHAEQWLEGVINRFDNLKIVEVDWLYYMSSLLTSKARVWFGKNRHMQDFNEFIDCFTSEFGIKVVPKASTTTTARTITSATDPIEMSLQKTLNEQVIKNLKKFTGKKENVIGWLDDLEAQFNAHGWSEAFKMKCIPTILQENALKWYNRNSSSITSWQLFVTQIKKEYSSLFKEQLAFEKMKNYHQSTNQSVVDFYNGMFDISREIDPIPADHNILQHLQSNVKPSLKLKILEKQPKSTAEFLQLARTFEHLADLAQNDSTLITEDEIKYVPPPRRDQQQLQCAALKPQQTSSPSMPQQQQQQRPYANSRRTYASNRWQQRQRNQDFSGCFICRSSNHYARDCPEKQNF
jgi:zinc knuckle protein